MVMLICDADRRLTFLLSAVCMARNFGSSGWCQVDLCWHDDQDSANMFGLWVMLFTSLKVVEIAAD